MKALKLTPMLRTDKIQETITFYESKLNFVYVERNEEWGWAAMHNNSIDLMLAVPNAHTPFVKPAFTGSFYFVVEDVAALWERLKDVVTVVYPIEDFEWKMREFAIYDNNGYMLQFGQDISEV